MRSKKDLFLLTKAKLKIIVESQNYSPQSQVTLMQLYDQLDSEKTDNVDCRLILVGMCALSTIPLEERFQCKKECVFENLFFISISIFTDAIEIYEIDDLE